MMMLMLINVKCSARLPFLVSFRKPQILIIVLGSKCCPATSLHAHVRKNVILRDPQNTEARLKI